MDRGRGFVGDLFPKKFLKSKQCYSTTFEVIRNSLINDDPWALKRVLKKNSKELGIPMVENIKEKF